MEGPNEKSDDSGKDSDKGSDKGGSGPISGDPSSPNFDLEYYQWDSPLID